MQLTALSWSSFEILAAKINLEKLKKIILSFISAGIFLLLLTALLRSSLERLHPPGVNSEILDKLLSFIEGDSAPAGTSPMHYAALPRSCSL